MANTTKKTTVKSLDTKAKETSKVVINSQANVQISDYVLVNVKSNVFGELIYCDSKTKEEIRWNFAGDIQQMSMGLLRSMRATQNRFFENQWVLIMGFADENAEKYSPSAIYEALHITQYYKVIVDPSDFDMICSWTPSEIEQNVKLLSNQAKHNLTVALNTYIEEGRLDSIRSIKAFEKALGCELTIPE